MNKKGYPESVNYICKFFRFQVIKMNFCQKTNNDLNNEITFVIKIKDKNDLNGAYLVFTKLICPQCSDGRVVDIFVLKRLKISNKL